MGRNSCSNKQIPFIRIGKIITCCYLWGCALVNIGIYILILGLSSPVICFYYVGFVFIAYLSATMIALPFLKQNRKIFLYKIRHGVALFSILSVGFLLYVVLPLELSMTGVFVLCFLISVVIAQLLFISNIYKSGNDK